mmetsp:Transcript_26680/g.25716  ORF Transcript_26680/g.25716 Transcript_26680/m.25716 type:complete len:97 (-) Transcript_26680:1488-1778(-)
MVPRTAKHLWPQEPQVYETADFYPQQSEGSLQTIDDGNEKQYVVKDPVTNQLILVDQNGMAVNQILEEGEYFSQEESHRPLQSTFKGISDYQDNDC